MVAGHLQEKNDFYYIVTELQGHRRKAKDQVGSHRSVRQEEQEESRGSFAGTSEKLHGSHRTCGNSLRR